MKPSTKAAYKVKTVKPIKKAVLKVQKSLDSYHMSHPNVITTNPDQDIDHEAHVDVDSAEWADVDGSQCSLGPNVASQQSMLKPARLDLSSMKPNASHSPSVT